MALRRGLWHIFDNLLNNIYKYAQAGPQSLFGFIRSHSYLKRHAVIGKMNKIPSLIG